ncbi:MAG: hypothetical protein LBR48_09920 [Dysgonamonadaceae bacterium]|jgi:hypothetical protein|nr:hypothetical protein [Dysgonamonadaceae bacterium]
MIGKSTILILFFAILVSCHTKSTETTHIASRNSTDEGCIPFEYDFVLKKAILIPGTLNDSIDIKYWLETGIGEIMFSDSLASDYERDKINNRQQKTLKPMTVKIGPWKRDYGEDAEASYLDKNHFAFEWLGSDVAMLPWDFFDGKIIKISFIEQCIKELQDTKSLSGYDSVKITKLDDFYSFLGIPITVFIQENKIQELVTIDTGFNGSVRFNNGIVSKYNIKIDQQRSGKGRGFAGFIPHNSLRADTIMIGQYIVPQKHFVNFAQSKKDKSPFSGLLGNKVLDNFDIVLDLKNYYLYLKPIDN